ncbi:hypothetical protein PoB_001085400 [Plakobranchus ocellatus]|uniref:Uncharacterized protein n=1 Tax=Plakobranchus ocellatus TaxID=259542 RepID=A0AAV3YQJ2_9GAST|nr:hypothetical protein PoB_001085400 [Plakobranchus ocellatus]
MSGNAHRQNVWITAVLRALETVGAQKPVPMQIPLIASPQQDNLMISGHPSGQGAGDGARTCDRRAPAISGRTHKPLCQRRPICGKTDFYTGDNLLTS